MFITDSTNSWDLRKDVCYSLPTEWVMGFLVLVFSILLYTLPAGLHAFPLYTKRKLLLCTYDMVRFSYRCPRHVWVSHVPNTSWSIWRTVQHEIGIYVQCTFEYLSVHKMQVQYRRWKNCVPGQSKHNYNFDGFLKPCKNKILVNSCCTT